MVSAAEMGLRVFVPLLPLLPWSVPVWFDVPLVAASNSHFNTCSGEPLSYYRTQTRSCCEPTHQGPPFWPSDYM